VYSDNTWFNLTSTNAGKVLTFEAGKTDIHAISAMAIDRVDIRKGEEVPIVVEITMNNSAGIFQVDELPRAAPQAPARQAVPLANICQVACTSAGWRGPLSTFALFKTRSSAISPKVFSLATRARHLTRTHRRAHQRTWHHSSLRPT